MILWLASLWVFGCGGAPTPATGGVVEPSVSVTEAASPTVSSSATTETPRASKVGSTAWFVEITPDQGSFDEQLAEQVKQANKAGKAVFVEVYGDWCAPCRDLRDSLSDPRMQDAFAGTWIVQLNTSLWTDLLENAAWVGDSYAVPSFYEVSTDGVVGQRITGHAWGANTAENMAPPLRSFFREYGAKAP